MFVGEGEGTGMMVGIGSGVGSGHMITVRLLFDGSRDAALYPLAESGINDPGCANARGFRVRMSVETGPLGQAVYVKCLARLGAPRRASANPLYLRSAVFRTTRSRRLSSSGHGTDATDRHGGPAGGLGASLSRRGVVSTLRTDWGARDRSLVHCRHNTRLVRTRGLVVAR